MGEVSLEDEKIDAFDNFVRWLYAQNITSTHLKHDLWIDTYLLADKLCMEAFKNKILDLVRRMHVKQQMTVAAVKLLVESGPQRCQLIEYCVQQLAYDLVYDGYHSYMDNVDGDQTLPEAGPEVLALLFLELEKAHKAEKDHMLVDPAILSGCHFHDHKDTDLCEARDEEE
jgi:hypothetical protein